MSAPCHVVFACVAVSWPAVIEDVWEENKGEIKKKIRPSACLGAGFTSADGAKSQESRLTKKKKCQVWFRVSHLWGAATWSYGLVWSGLAQEGGRRDSEPIAPCPMPHVHKYWCMCPVQHSLSCLTAVNGLLVDVNRGLFAYWQLPMLGMVQTCGVPRCTILYCTILYIYICHSLALEQIK